MREVIKKDFVNKFSQANFDKGDGFTEKVIKSHASEIWRQLKKAGFIIYLP